ERSPRHPFWRFRRRYAPRRGVVVAHRLGPDAGAQSRPSQAVVAVSTHRGPEPDAHRETYAHCTASRAPASRARPPYTSTDFTDFADSGRGLRSPNLVHFQSV